MEESIFKDPPLKKKKLQEMKPTMAEIFKKKKRWIPHWVELTTVLDIAEEKINELDDIAMKSFQNEAQRKKDFKQDEHGTPVDCGTISRGQIYVSSKLPKERREKKSGKKYLKIAGLKIFQF